VRDLEWSPVVYNGVLQTGCFEAEESHHLYSVNLLNGTVLVNGVPPRLLPSSVIEDPLYRRTFGERNSEVNVLGFRHYRATRRVDDRFFYEFVVDAAITFLSMMTWRVPATSCCSCEKTILTYHLYSAKNTVTGFLNITGLSPCVNHPIESDASSMLSDSQHLTPFHPSVTKFLYKKSWICFQPATDSFWEKQLYRKR
jgi:hypothetical protein